MEGILSTGLTASTGVRTNISERLSPGGNRFFADLLGDSSMLEIVFGASGSALRENFLAAQPFLTFVLDSFRPPDRQVGARISIADIERAIAAAGGRGASAAMRTYWAISLNELMSTQRLSLTGMTNAETAIFALTGLTPQRVSTAFNILQSERSLADHQRRHERFIVQSYREMMRASLEGRMEDAFRHSQDMRVHLALGMFRPDQHSALVGRINRDMGDLVENAFMRFARHGPRYQEFYQQYLHHLNK